MLKTRQIIGGGRRAGGAARGIMHLMLAAAATVWLGASAWGQYQLDNNLQVGSGRINPAATPADFNARNELVYGNVTGFSFFRGSTSVGSPQQFQGSLGSNDLFRFRAISSSASSMNGGLGNGGLGGYSLGPTFNPVSQPQVIDRSFSGASVQSLGLSAGQLPRGQMLQTLDVTSSSVVSPFNVDLSAADSIGVIRQPGGQPYSVRASQLMGVRVEPLSVDYSAQRRAVGLGEDTAGDRDDDAGLAGLRTTVELGTRLQSLRDARLSADPSVGVAGRVEQLEAGLFSPLNGGDQRAGEDAYVDLLRNIRQQQRLRDGTSRPGSDAGELGGAGDDVMSLEAPTVEELSAARAARDAAMRRALGLGSAVGVAGEAEDGAEAGDGGDAEGDDASEQSILEERMPASLRRVLETLDYDLPRLETFVGSSKDRAADLLRRAQSELSAGEYVKAESLFNRSLMQSPDQPLARAGLVHSQLGAGMIRSAGLNLRRLLVRHPELIAARYDRALLPSEGRMQWIRGRLMEYIKDTDHAEPAMILAYLGYQTGSPELIRFGLDTAQWRRPDDSLLPLLRRIWLERSEGESADRPDEAGVTGPAGDRSSRAVPAAPGGTER